MVANNTAVWRIRISGNNNNGGGYDAGIASAGTDYSQQNAAQVTQSGGTVSTATVTLTDTGASFTSALIGNGIRVAGTGITTTYTYITAVPSGTTLTLQDSPGTTGTSVTFSIGGGWADFTNTTSTAGWLQPGNYVYILGSGTPNPSSYTYDYTVSASFSITSGLGSQGFLFFANDPSTPGYKAFPDTTGGMPVIKVNGAFASDVRLNVFVGLWFVLSGTSTDGIFKTFSNATGPGNLSKGCVFDQFGFDSGVMTTASANQNVNIEFYGCEMFSSAGGSGSVAIVNCGNYTNFYWNCNIHDTVGPGVNMGVAASQIHSCIVAKCHGYGVKFTQPFNGVACEIRNCTIDGNTGSGIEFGSGALYSGCIVYNNIISNHTTGGTYGLDTGFGGGAGTAAYNQSIACLIDFNVFYNNTSNYNNIAAGPHDTALSSDPYVGQSTENYQLA